MWKWSNIVLIVFMKHFLVYITQVKLAVEMEEVVSHHITVNLVEPEDLLKSNHTLVATVEDIIRESIKNQTHHIKGIRLIKSLKFMSLLPIEL